MDARRFEQAIGAVIGGAHALLGRELAQQHAAAAAQVSSLSRRSLLPGPVAQAVWAAATSAWKDPLWNAPPVVPAPGAPDVIRIGDAVHRLSASGVGYTHELPALAPLFGGKCLFLLPRRGGEDQAVQGLQLVLWRLLAATAPGSVRVTLVDPVAKGMHFHDFVRLDPLLLGGHTKVATTRQEIRERVQGLAEDLATLVQRYLSPQCPDLETYNRAASDGGEPYRVLAYSHLPSELEPELWNSLRTLAHEGPRAGIYLVASLSPDDLNHLHSQAREEVERLLRRGLVLRQDSAGGHWNATYDGAGLPEWEIRLDAPPPRPVRDALLARLGAEARVLARSSRVFLDLLPPKPWQARIDLKEDVLLRAPIGWRPNRELQFFEVSDRESPNTLILGQAGSGKSRLLHALILSLCANYSPEDVAFYLVDLKGTEFDLMRQLPHARLVSMEADRDFALGVLRATRNEIERRRRLFARSTSLRGWLRDHPGKRLPVVFLVIDEFQKLLSERDDLTKEAHRILEVVAREGRSFGVHMVLSSQSLLDVDLSPSLLGLMGIRIPLRLVQERDARIALAPDNTEATRLERSGQAIYNGYSGQAGRNQLFQAAFLETPVEDAIVVQLAARARAQGRVWSPHVVDARQAADFMKARTGNDGRRDAPHAVVPCRFAIGEPLAPNVDAGHEREWNHIEVVLERQANANVLVVGQDPGAAASLFAGACASFGAGAGPSRTRIEVFDFMPSSNPFRAFGDGVRRLPQPVTIHPGQGPTALGRMAALHAEMQERREELDRSGAERPEAVLLLLFGLQRGTEFLRREGSFAAPPEAVRQLGELCQDGPAVGIHVLAWIDAVNGVERVFGGRDAPQFSTRILLKGGGSERLAFEHAAACERMHTHEGILVDRDAPGSFCRFKCYSEASLRTFLNSLPVNPSRDAGGTQRGGAR